MVNGATINDIVAGGISAVAGTVVGHPFDTLKVRAQATSTPALQIGLQMLRADGGVGMMRGLSAALSGYVPLDIIMFATYGAALRYLNGRDESAAPRSLPSLWNYAAAGALAGVVYAPISVPVEIVKIRMQLDVGRMGMGQMASRIVRTEGVSALAQGMRITLLREVPEHAIWFASFEGFKRALRRADRGEEEMDHFASLFGGGLAGVVAYMAMFPVDTVKTRIQMSAAPTTSADVVRHILATHGLRGFFRGALPVALRSFPENAAMLWVYDAAMHWLEQQ